MGNQAESKRKKQAFAKAIVRPGKGPWYDWIESEEGKQAADIETLCPIKIGSQNYLENRLWWAYTAGMKAGFEQAKNGGTK